MCDSSVTSTMGCGHSRMNAHTFDMHLKILNLMTALPDAILSVGGVDDILRHG